MNKYNWWGLKPLGVHLFRLLWLPAALLTLGLGFAILFSVIGLKGLLIFSCFCILCAGSYWCAYDLGWLDEYL